MTIKGLLTGHGMTIMGQDAVPQAYGDLTALIERLLEMRPLDARGMALVLVLIRDGAGPLYRSGYGIDLRSQLQAAMSALSALPNGSGAPPKALEAVACTAEYRKTKGQGIADAIEPACRARGHRRPHSLRERAGHGRAMGGAGVPSGELSSCAATRQAAVGGGGYVEYRLCLEAPGYWAALMLETGTGRFASGPLPEVAASSHSWSELAPHLHPTPQAGMAAHERVLRGDDLTTDPVAATLPEVLDLPLRLEPWEPKYVVAEYHTDSLEAPPPRLPPLQPRDGTGARQTGPDQVSGAGQTSRRAETDEVSAALEDLVTTWTEESNGRPKLSLSRERRSRPFPLSGRVLLTSSSSRWRGAGGHGVGGCRRRGSWSKTKGRARTLRSMVGAGGAGPARR